MYGSLLYCRRLMFFYYKSQIFHFTVNSLFFYMRSLFYYLGGLYYFTGFTVLLQELYILFTDIFLLFLQRILHFLHATAFKLNYNALLDDFCNMINSFQRWGLKRLNRICLINNSLQYLKPIDYNLAFIQLITLFSFKT